MKRRELLNRAAALSLPGAAISLPGGARAQGAGKTITLLSAFPPGGITDTVAPLLAKSSGQTVVVDNITGASGTIAANRMFSMAPDGSMILMVSPSETILPPIMMSSVRFRSEDFQLLVNGPSVPLALLARPGLPVKNLAELLAYARNPTNKPLNYGSIGIGSVPHLAAEHFTQLTGIKMVHVPYRGGPPLINDLIANVVDIAFFPFAGGTIQFVETGKVQMLGLALNQKLPQYAKFDLLTNHPQLKSFNHSSWQSMAISKAAASSVSERLNRELNAIFQGPEMKELAAKNGSFIPEAQNLAQIEANFQAEINRTRALAKAINLQAQ